MRFQYTSKKKERMGPVSRAPCLKEFQTFSIRSGKIRPTQPNILSAFHRIAWVGRKGMPSSPEDQTDPEAERAAKRLGSISLEVGF